MELISIGKFAKMVGLTPTTLRRMHDTGERIPCHISKGGTHYYSTEQLDKFLNSNHTKKKVIELVEVPAFHPSSKTCSCCGNIKKDLKLSDRVYKCSHCGLVIDRDFNNALWYHGSNVIFDVLREGSTITQWKQLAKAFSHQPSLLSYMDDGIIKHNGTEEGDLYIINEKITIDIDIIQHPNTSMDKNAEFITLRPLRVKLIEHL